MIEFDGVPGIVYADMLGTSSRTDSSVPDSFDRHVVQYDRAAWMLNSLNQLLSASEFASSESVLVSDCLFAVFQSPLAAARFAVGFVRLCVQRGVLLRAAVETGAVWKPPPDYPAPAGVKTHASPLMGYGITSAAVQAEKGLKGTQGSRLALGPFLVRWLSHPKGGLSPEHHQQSTAIRQLMAPPGEPAWQPAPQLLWMHQATADSLQKLCTNVHFNRIDQLIKDVSLNPPEIDATGLGHWQATQRQLERYQELQG